MSVRKRNQEYADDIPSSQQPGPSGLHLPSSFDSSDDETVEDDKYCVCSLFTPEEVRVYPKFVDLTHFISIRLNLKYFFYKKLLTSEWNTMLCFPTINISIAQISLILYRS
jgi:hypothetical protein